MIHPDLTNLKWHTPHYTAANKTSCANCRNGEIIFVFNIEKDSNAEHSVKQGFATDYDTFMVSGSIGSVQNAFYDPGLSFKGSVCNVGNDLYMGVSSCPSNDGLGMLRSVLYKSASGNGRDENGNPDWVEHGIFTELNYTGGWIFGGLVTPGRICVLPSGRWICTHSAFNLPGLAWERVAGISTSDDEGQTWTLRHSRGIGFGGWYTWGASRTIEEYNGSLYAFVNGNTSDGHFLKGTIDGVNWTFLYHWPLSYGNQPLSEEPYNIGDGYLYTFTDSYSGGIIVVNRSTQPEDRTQWEEVARYSLGGLTYFQWPCLNPLKNSFGIEHMIICAEKYVSEGGLLPAVQCKATNRILSARTKKIITPIRF